MIEIQYPQPDFNIQQRDGQPFIFDVIRKKWLLLQDEEWVRQNFINYLLCVMKYPKTLIALEKEIRLGGLKKRFEILVYDTMHRPWMLIECKSQNIEVNHAVFHQILRYNISMPAEYLIITNGNTTLGWQKKNNGLIEIDCLPEYRISKE